MGEADSWEAQIIERTLACILGDMGRPLRDLIYFTF